MVSSLFIRGSALLSVGITKRRHLLDAALAIHSLGEYDVAEGIVLHSSTFIFHQSFPNRA